MIVRDDNDCRFWLWLLGDVVRTYGWSCYAFCLMGNHYHLVAAAKIAAFAAGFHRLNGVHAIRFNRRYERKGHLFGDRYASRVIETDEHLASACDYVIQNPVRAGLCRTADEWPWSGLAPHLRPLDEHTFGG